MKLLTLLCICVLNSSCGLLLLSDGEDKKEKDSGAVALATTAGTIYVEDNKYELTCNPYMMPFWIDRENSECEAITISQTSDTWTITSADKSVSLEALEIDQATLKIAGKTLHCYFYRGSLMEKDGTNGMHGTHTVLSEKVVEKPSQLTKDDVYAIGFNDGDNCDYIK